jgi:DNA-cytosine methyltransferase
VTFGSLFAGIGGLDLGLERAGMRCCWQIEIDPFCRQVLAKHWPDVKRYGDITTIHGSELEPVDLICGGFPCQDVSQAGKRTGIDGSRTGLWSEFARLVGVLRPRYVLAENVPGLLTSDGAMGRVVGDMARLGYVGLWRCYRAADFGASHLRKRVFIVAYRQEHIGRREQIGIRGSALPAGDCATRVELAHLPESRSRGISEPNGWYDAADIDWRGSELADPGEGTGTRLDPEAGNWRLDPERGSDQLDDTNRESGRGSPSEAKPSRNESQEGDAWKAGRCVADTGAGQLPEPERGPEGRTGTRSAGAFAPGPADPRWAAILAERPDLAPALESTVCGVADGLSDWMDQAMKDRTKRLSRLGNAVVPQIAEEIGRRILEAESTSATLAVAGD